MFKQLKHFYRWYNRRHKSTIAYYAKTISILVPLAFIIRTFIYGLYLVPTGCMETTMLVGERFWADKLTILFRPIKHGDIVSFNAPSVSFHYSDNYFVNLFQRYVYGPSNWTKRVLGLPGDHMKGVIENGKPVVYRNGQKLDEPYLNHYPLIAAYEKISNGMLWTYLSYDPSTDFNKQPFYRMEKEKINLAKNLVEKHGYEPIKNPHTPTVGESGRIIDEFDVILGEDEYWLQGDNRKGSWDSRHWGPLDGKLIHGRIVFRILSIDTNESSLILDLIKHPFDIWNRVRWSRCMQWVS